jgi:hypothetical protein
MEGWSVNIEILFWNFFFVFILEQKNSVFDTFL